MSERWLNIDNVEYAQISSFGRVRNSISGKVRKLQTHPLGYSMVHLYENHKPVLRQVHRLVANAFIPNPENKRCVNHVNSIKTDNRVENLEWATHGENSKHFFEIGALKRRNNGSTKIIVLDTETGIYYKSVAEAAKTFGMSYQVLSARLRGAKVNKTKFIAV